MFGGVFIIMLVFIGISWYVGSKLKRRFKEYSQIPTTSGLSGAEIAKRMLGDHGIHGVEVMSVQGQLTDHYNPSNRTINLSYDVYHGRNVAAAAVAAHETGHAVQHAKSYAMLNLRTAMVPVVSLSSKLMNILFIATMIFGFGFSMFSYQTMITIVIVAQLAITAFSLVTLPVEFDASDRALTWLGQSGITRGNEYTKAKNALTWAASTYVVAALASITTLLYYVLNMVGDD